MSPSGFNNQPQNLPFRSSKIRFFILGVAPCHATQTATIFSSSVEIDEDCHSGVVRFEFFRNPFAVTIFVMLQGRKIFYSRMQSPVGTLLLAATQQGLARLQFGADLPCAAADELWIESRDQLRSCEEQLNAYFCGDLREFTLPLDLRGTPFQLRCWEALQRIPYGNTWTYGQLADQIGTPRAFRAVGQANHRNPVAIIVPCHRVIGANGTLTGYGGGLNVKQVLLRLETGQLHTLFADSRTA
jgi:O-6-methylguanine DNA methyltransferase